uniref:TIR domain-containing protein n=1 Tax=Octactis speculum TaxID=3111310 RepID=A0A7S2FHB6_9STRA
MLHWGLNFASLPFCNAEADWMLCMVLTAVFILPAIHLGRRWLRTYMFKLAGSKARRYPTKGFWEILNVYSAVNGIHYLMLAFDYLSRPDSDSSGTMADYFVPHATTTWLSVLGFGIFLPPLALFVFGQQVIFGFLVRRIDSMYYAKDGGFLAELFMAREFEIGDVYWVQSMTLQRLLLQIDSPVPEQVYRREWCPGVIISLNDDITMQAIVKVEGIEMTVAGLRNTLTLEEILDSNAIRCVAWEKLTLESMMNYNSKTSDEIDDYELSRPLGKGKHIDFFISHSWRDNAEVKWECLMHCAESFFKARGRYPTFWIDKFCLQQGSQAACGLKMLCKCITTCDKILLLCGPTFPRRLWCAWEIFTSFAFQAEAQALERVLLIPMDVKNDTEGVMQSKALLALERFDVNKATCYDPNDELAMKNIISVVGRSDFNGYVRRMARSVRYHMAHAHRRKKTREIDVFIRG